MTSDDDVVPAVEVDDGGRTLLPGIGSRAFEHPADRSALTAMRALPGFDQVQRVASSMLRDRKYRLVFLASAVRVDERQFAGVDRLFGEVLKVLDVAERPELYVFNDPRPNSFTLGVDHPFIAVSSGLYELMTEDELRFVLGHETGHVLSGHAVYQSLLMHLLSLAGAFGWVPVGGLGLRSLVAALREWERKAELSADRAGLLATQDVDNALRVQMKLAAGAHVEQIDVDAFLAQAAEYDESGDLRDGVLKLLNTERTSYPFAVTRARELRRWVDGGDYQRILDGEYAHRDAQHDDKRPPGSTGEATYSYRKRIDESVDPIVNVVRGLGSSLGSAADNLADWINRRPRPAADQPAPPEPDETDDTDRES